MQKPVDILAAFAAIGVRQGDTLVVQSSYKGTGGVEGGVPALVEALKEVVGATGTLIMPAYNFTSWTEQHYFDSRETPAKIGAVTEVFRLSAGVRRSRHPIHSLCVYGRLRDELCEMDYADSFGPDSVFSRLLDMNVLYTTLGTRTEMPFLPCHYPETLLKVPYRRQKMFSGIYVDETGQPSIRTYGFHVRQVPDQPSPVYPAHVMQFERGHVREHVHQGMSLMYARAREYHDSMVELIRDNPAMFE
jgi:aminoglycoside N3'-acetyltransferase